MDHANTRDNVFSRGPSPPPQQSFGALSQVNDPHVSPAPSYREPPPASSTTHLDNLFQTLNAPSTSHISPQPSNNGSNIYAGPQEANSGHATPASVNAGSISSSMSGPSNQIHERQNALLSLLGSTVSGPSNVQTAPVAPAPPQQVPTPPGSAPRSGMTASESQGKFLLEQLMSGNAPKYNYPEPVYPSVASAASGPSPPYVATTSDTGVHHDVGDIAPPEVLSNPYGPPTSEMLGPLPAHEQRVPSPARKSQFDVFVSPFDALANTSSNKRKPPPSQQPSTQTNTEEFSFPSLTMDPKRKSVENLMEQLTRGPVPQPAPVQQMSSYDPYTPSEELTPQAEPAQARASRPLPPQPSHAPSPPRLSPPKQQAQVRQQHRRSAESPVGSAVYGPAPPVSGSGYRNSGSEGRGRGGLKNKVNSPSSQPQSIVFDVSQPLEEIQAPHDAVKTTAIALVKVDATFLPGTTIGATHWVAYAMTKGRVRVISRSSGDRTLLQLPPPFPPQAAVSDMSVHGNRLAGVTSDGGFVVWELPEVITDDVPGEIMLCVEPTDVGSLHAVKWHPQEPDLVAVASEKTVFLINIPDAAHAFSSEPIPQAELHRVAQTFSVSSPIVAIDFDVPRSALATISEDGTLTMWNINDRLPFWSHRIRGDDIPSSLTFVENGVVIGRKNGTIFQLLGIMGRHVLSTAKFVNSVEDPEMFGHVSYDSRIQTLWVANNRRDSMFALRIAFDNSAPSPVGEDTGKGAYFDQVLEFRGPRPTIHFVILTADADPTGEEGLAACNAAKVPPGELALVAFSVHATGVDQVLIRSEWFNSALTSAPARFPVYLPPQSQAAEVKQRPGIPPLLTGGSIVQQAPPPQFMNVNAVRRPTPPSEDVEGDHSRDESGRLQEPKGKNTRGKNVGWKDKEKDDGKEKEGKARGGDPAILNESPLGVALTKEMRKVEENLHTRIGRLIGKELDKQHQRLEDARAHEQAEDFARQEKILKLISTELSKNTTRVVEMAVKNEVQNSVLPSLENITKTEVKAALGNQISKGLSDSFKQNLPTEIERMLLRPEVSNQIARNVSNAVTPVVERQVKETVSKNLLQAYQQQSGLMHQELSREIRNEIMGLKQDVKNWQDAAFRTQENMIRELEQTVRSLADQMRVLNHNSVAPSRTSPSGTGNQSQGTLSQLLRQQTLPPPVSQPPYSGQHGSFQGPQMPASMHQPWFNQNIAAPQASHPTAPPLLPPQQQPLRTSPPTQTEEWDDTYLAVLGTQDVRQLRELLARSNPEVVMPLKGSGPLSQAVVLTLVHRLSSIVGETSPLDESFKVSMWWLQRAASTLNTADPLISPYVTRVLPSVQQMLNTTKQRLNIIPGPPIEATRTISDIQDILGRKPL
ncbi:hypothetical protein DAEQUDRAFT_757242 [Daedalea quercina L-15889]|uniref:Enhancer of mRNA-decapping protein 4 WD40 repeat region domain-containing protein n=1 Tax=Daedalea quercina L-15889 TaxID=1314783 RepID=A0A165Q5L8_9APHY|nr:hypothetical protein DAEQUDRAFT_757242 [Daedalea quercina L-15889]